MIKKIILLNIFLSLFACSTKPPEKSKTSNEDEQDTSIVENKKYNGAYTRLSDLVHTRLNVSFNWQKKELNGQASITLHPHFYSSDSLILNARGMEIKEVSLLGQGGGHIPLKFDYDSLMIKIKLDRIYKKEENYTVYIDYISRPDKLPNGGSAAITNDKGLYFIDADSTDSERPTEVWTQGETESNSVWFPTIEDPSQKMTQEIYITVDTAFKTLSNGLLISSVKNNNGTRTDYWKQSLPAAPYLTMLTAGNYAIVKDKWKNIEVSYYVDPPYEKYARMTFGETPAMIDFFSNLLGVPFAWEKYSQVVVHDYVSGAMENTTAVIHGTNMQQDSRDFADGDFEEYISHELFHHWFGDLVTCESWSNLTLNEGFANYAEYLWNEHKYGRDKADHASRVDLDNYLFVAEESDPQLIRYYYDNREDLYDAISYNKGGRVLRMLRSYVGDTAFFASLHDYLASHLFSTAEVHDLRLSFEKITGEDLNWFFNQWFLSAGHPVISIDYKWEDSLQQQTVIIKQKQSLVNNPLYRLPMAVDFYYNGKIDHRKITLEDTLQNFEFTLPVKPDLVNVDADKSLLCSKTDNKTMPEYIFQYNHAPLYLDRFEAVIKVGSKYKINTPEAAMMMKALHDKYYSIRINAIQNIGELAMNNPDTVKPDLIKLATLDSSADVRDKALTAIGKYYSYAADSALFIKALNDSSYKVVARAFKIISEKDSAKAKEIAPSLEKDSGSAIITRLSEYYSSSSDNKIAFYKRALQVSEIFSSMKIISDFKKYLSANQDPEIVSAGTELLIDRAKRPAMDFYTSTCLNALKEIQTSVKKKIKEKTDEITGTKETSVKAEKHKQLQYWEKIQTKLGEEIALLDK